jgi:hypothetical protein
MKTALSTAVVLSTLTFVHPAAADAGSRCHFHGAKPAAEATVIGCARERVASLVKVGKLDASWQGIQPGKPEQIDGKKGKEWKLVFSNPSVADKGKGTLYLFYTLPGNFIAANYTGQ